MARDARRTVRKGHGDHGRGGPSRASRDRGPGAVRRAPGFPPGSFHGFVARYADEAQPGFQARYHPAGSLGIALLDVCQDPIEITDRSQGRAAFVTQLGAPADLEADFGDGWRRHVARRGVVDLMPSGLDIAYRLPRLHLNTLALDAAMLEAKLDEIGLRPAALDAVTGEFRNVPKAAALLEMAAAAARAGGPSAGLIVDGAFLAMLGVLLRASGEDRHDAPVPPIGDRRMARVLEHVEAHLDAPLGVADLAAVAEISVFHFSRVFHAAVGVSPHRYVTQRRVERARRLLADPAIPLAQVAFSAGFASQSHMGAVFKAHTGTTPGAYRAAVAS